MNWWGHMIHVLTRSMRVGGSLSDTPCTGAYRHKQLSKSHMQLLIIFNHHLDHLQSFSASFSRRYPLCRSAGVGSWIRGNTIEGRGSLQNSGWSRATCWSLDKYDPYFDKYDKRVFVSLHGIPGSSMLEHQQNETCAESVDQRTSMNSPRKESVARRGLASDPDPNFAGWFMMEHPFKWDVP